MGNETATRPRGPHAGGRPDGGRPRRWGPPRRKVCRFCVDRVVEIAGVVTHRQRPATASGTTFMNIEDETGLVNVVCSAGAWARYRRVARSSPALLIRGRIEKVDGVINVVVDRIDQLHLSTSTMRSRDFR